MIIYLKSNFFPGRTFYSRIELNGGLQNRKRKEFYALVLMEKTLEIVYKYRRTKLKPIFKE